VPTLSDIQKDREGMDLLHEIVETLKGASAARLHGLQEQKKSTKFNEYLEDFFRILNLQHVVHPFLREEISPPVLIIAFTSTDSFTGEVNSLIASKVIEGFTPERDEIIVLGKRGAGLIEDQGVKCSVFEQGLDEEQLLPVVRALTNTITAKYLKDKFKKVDIVYPHFVSLARQEVVKLNILPFHPAKAIRGVQTLPEKGLIEPSVYRVAEILVKLWMLRRLTEICWESNVSFAAGRILRLEGSGQELARVKEQLRKEYFRVKHALNDKSIREVFAARIDK